MGNPSIYSILLKNKYKIYKEKMLKNSCCLIRIRQNEVKNNSKFKYLSVSKYKY